MEFKIQSPSAWSHIRLELWKRWGCDGVGAQTQSKASVPSFSAVIPPVLVSPGLVSTHLVFTATAVGKSLFSVLFLHFYWGRWILSWNGLRNCGLIQFKFSKWRIEFLHKNGVWKTFQVETCWRGRSCDAGSIFQRACKSIINFQKAKQVH